MIIHPDIRYRMDVLPKRARKVRRAMGCRPETPIAVAETTAEDAPVVLTVAQLGSDSRADVRLSRGRFWIAVEANPDGDGDPTPTAQDLIEIHLQDEHVDPKSRNAAGADRDWTRYAGVVSLSHQDFAIGTAQSFADTELLAVDGVLHRRGRSPVLREADLIGPYGEDCARRFCPKGILPVWFPATFGGRTLSSLLRDLAPDGDAAAARAVSLADVAFVRSDLLPSSIGDWGALTNLSVPLRWLSESRSRNPRPHEGVDGSAFAGEAKDAFDESIAAVAAEAASDRGPVEALAAAVDAMRPLAGGRPARGVADPASDAPRTIEAEIFFHLGVSESVPMTVHKQGGEGWTTVGTSTGSARVAIAVLDPSDVSPILETERTVFRTERLEIASGPLGTMLRIEDSDFHPTLACAHASRLSLAARLLSAWGRTLPTVGSDHFGESLASDPPLPPLRSEAVRRTILSEYARHRLVDVGGRTFVRCPEPLIAVHPPHVGTPDVRMDIDVSYVSRTRPGPYPPLFFRPDREEEALLFAAGIGAAGRDRLPILRLRDTGPAAFDTGLWNLRSSLLRILPGMDRRLRLLRPDAVAAVGRAFKHLDAWCMDPRLVDDPRHVADFLADASTIVPLLGSPVFEDVGETWTREAAVASLSDALGRARGMDRGVDAEDERGWDLSM